jgi:uncharacterized protein (TIGR02001 family)
MKKISITHTLRLLEKVFLGLLLATSLQVTWAEEAESKVTGNMTLASDYRFRGFTQSNYGPALQGGLDWEHRNGLYVGNWNSNVSQNLYNGATLEMDLYAGLKGEWHGLLGTHYDVGAIYYGYPKSGSNSAQNSLLSSNTAINNTEVYLGLSNGPLSLKVNLATSDYFSMASSLKAPLSTKGTTYFDLGYSQEFVGLVFGAHVGVLGLKNYKQAPFLQASELGMQSLTPSVNDYKLSIGKDFGDNAVVSANYFTTSKKGYFQTDAYGLRSAGKSGLTLGFTKGF